MTKRLIVDEDELYEVYSTLADATEAASTGDPNTVAKKAREAKEQVLMLRDSAKEHNREP